ncbi:hypothetical protein FQA39_LY15197 [Lamprigera yunnana]|nr:hypothetical protein FQA39_LY15197 [Lamprigera yunnana]
MEKKTTNTLKKSTENRPKYNKLAINDKTYYAEELGNENEQVELKEAESLKEQLMKGSRVEEQIDYEQNKIRLITVCPGSIETDLLKNFTGHMLDRICPNVHERVTDELSEFVLQKPEYLAKDIVKIISTARNGSMWIMIDNKPPMQVEVGRHYKSRSLR